MILYEIELCMSLQIFVTYPPRGIRLQHCYFFSYASQLNVMWCVKRRDRLKLSEHHLLAKRTRQHRKGIRSATISGVVLLLPYFLNPRLCMEGFYLQSNVGMVRTPEHILYANRQTQCNERRPEPANISTLLYKLAFNRAALSGWR